MDMTRLPTPHSLEIPTMASEQLDLSSLDDDTVHALWCALVGYVDDIPTDPPDDVCVRIDELHGAVTVEWDKRNGYLDE